MTDMIAGHVQFGFAQTQSSLPFLRDGKIRAIAITDDPRSRHMPDVPTFAELGYPEFTTRVWFGLFVRAGTPAPIVESLLAAAKTAHADTDVRGKLDAQGFDMSGDRSGAGRGHPQAERALGAADQGVGLQGGLTGGFVAAFPPFVPAKAGIQRPLAKLIDPRPWVPAFAGTTGLAGLVSFT